ncbi:DUF2591 domain-containing protein [Enterobacter cloacae]|uniref:phage protein NinX family protein n=1 Tax=Enterobacter cloacae TaxID=550 RepID=UPI002003875F|nr:phage protein NinX family protein [Enterobacter cloacae]MCK6743754.1 DUF2591 domain-containing protein [Enterobacter cloacae]MCK6783923.1 DUF2591 domain-containing protein [Enterobacter cloacae]
MDYSKLSDFEINRAVAIAIGFHPDECDIVKRGSPSVGVEWNEDTGYPIRVFDYCNNPTDAWPIIVDNRITMMIDDTTTDWSSALVQDFCDTSAFKYSNCSKNPLRAAMITFLMMQDKFNADV